MKKLILFSAALLFISIPAFAQDAPATGIGYIPGMPVPQQSAPADTPSDSAPKASNSGDSGRISKVTVADSNTQNSSQSTQQSTAQPVKIDDGPTGYKGVTPPTRLVPENQKTFTKNSGNQLSWIGFMPEQGAHRIFIQTSQPTQYERLATSSDRVELLIANTKLAVSNNQRELDMSYFQTPFAKAKAERAGSDVKVIVQLKEAAACDVQQHDNIIDIIVRK